MNIEQKKEKEIEHILETYSKEVKEYEEIEKILKRFLKKLKN